MTEHQRDELYAYALPVLAFLGALAYSLWVIGACESAQLALYRAGLG